MKVPVQVFSSSLLSATKKCDVIITNKHVIDHNWKHLFDCNRKKTIDLTIHTWHGDSPADENINISYTPDWYLHHDKHIDLCFCFVGPVGKHLKDEMDKDIFYACIDESKIWDNTQLEQLSAIEDVVMVGYPIGLSDEKNNLPLFRRGITASHPAIDFDGKKIGVVDMACFPGSSGSPIFVYNRYGNIGKSSSVILTNENKENAIFLGILFGGPQFDATGKLVIENIPTKQEVVPVTLIPINLGYYIKATEIMAFKRYIERILTDTHP